MDAKLIFERDVDCSWHEDNFILDAFPELENCVSITEASRVLFGVKTMGAFVRMGEESRKALTAFFAGNHSDMVAWAKHANPRGAFNAGIEHKAIYRTMIKAIGLPVAVRLTQGSDFADICTGFDFLRADKKRMARFEVDILSALPLFPVGSHAVMIHDYMVKQMKNADRKAQPRDSEKEVEVTLPPLPVAESVPCGEYQILVPRNDRDLKRIGNAQSHCVGTRGMGYGERVRRGKIHIVAVYRKGLADGICVEFDAESGDVLQAQGKHRRGMSDAESEIVQALANAIYAKRKEANLQK